jgi:hypothetical protein
MLMGTTKTTKTYESVSAQDAINKMAILDGQSGRVVMDPRGDLFFITGRRNIESTRRIDGSTEVEVAR